MLDEKTLKEKTLMITRKEYDNLLKTAKAYEILKDKNQGLTLENKTLLADNIKLRRLAEADIEEKRLMIADRFDRILNEVELIYDREVSNNGKDALIEKSDREVESIIKVMHSLKPNDEVDDNLQYIFIRLRHLKKQMICPFCKQKMIISNEYPITCLKKQEMLVMLTDQIFTGARCKTCNYMLGNMYESVRFINPVTHNIYIEPEIPADIITYKYFHKESMLHQEMNWNDIGLNLSYSSMTLWIREIYDKWLTSLYEIYHSALLNEKMICADVYKIYGYDLGNNYISLKNKRPMYLWIYRTPGRSDRKIILYEISDYDNSIQSAAFLKGYKGLIHTETPGAFDCDNKEYHILPLWENVRNLFEFALDSIHPRGQKESLAKKGLELCDKLILLEDSFSGSDDDIRIQLRLKKCKPLTDKLISIAQEFIRNESDPELTGNTSKAIDFICRYQSELEYYYKNPQVDTDNSWCRNAVSEFNDTENGWIIINTKSGCRSSAMLWSIMKSLQINDINTDRFISFWLRSAANPQVKTDKSSFLPWNVPPECCEQFEI